MFFSCSTCGTRLQIPDAQVVNRILKVRCTACSAVMTVRDPTTGRHQRPAEPAWFVAVGGQQKGPISLAELRALVVEGQANARSYAWTEGMAQWSRAGEIAALSTLFQAPPPLPPVAIDPMKAAAAEVEAKAVAEAQTEVADAFFAHPSALEAPLDIFDTLDASAAAGPTDAGRTARGRRASTVPIASSHAEMAALRQEFSVVASIERSKKKRWIWLGVGLLAAGAVAVMLFSGPLRRERIATDLANERKPFEAAVRPEVPVMPDPPVASPPEAPLATSEAEQKATRAPGAAKPQRALTSPPDRSLRTMSPKDFAALTEDEVGKTETRVDFDPGEAARKAADEAAAKRAQNADALSEEVAVAFGKKRSQFAKCSDDLQERVTVVFTVTSTGKVLQPRINGTRSDSKLHCLREILERSLFPAGPSALTYSQTLVL